jgi:predicted  nucleic acid-binding Zn-ribbon protein
MNEYVETMYVLQQRMRLRPSGLRGAATGVAELRARVPVPVLAHFDRMIAQGQKAVAEVHHGVCGACHLRLPTVITVEGTDHSDLQLCENCGAYLRFPEAEPGLVARAAHPGRKESVERTAE